MSKFLDCMASRNHEHVCGGTPDGRPEPPKHTNAHDKLVEACKYVADMLAQMAPGDWEEVTLAERLADLGGVRAERMVADALAEVAKERACES